MANKNLTEMVFILDRSGSMKGLEADTIGGYNGLLEKQGKEEGAAVVTTVLFDDKYAMIYDHADIGKVKNLTKKEYYARGMTALLDAIGITINHIENRHKYAPDAELPSKTMVVIITDGCENSSKEYTLPEIKEMIERQKEECGWEFLFLGANIDAVSTAAGLGISADRSVKYRADAMGTKINFEAINEFANCVRYKQPVTSVWKENIVRYMDKIKE